MTARHSSGIPMVDRFDFPDNTVVKPYDSSWNEGIRATFPNGYGASVVIGTYSYGGEQGLYEIAVLNDEGFLDYSTPVTDDVIGWCDVAKVNETLAAIAALPAPSTTVKGQ